MYKLHFSRRKNIKSRGCGIYTDSVYRELTFQCISYIFTANMSQQLEAMRLEILRLSSEKKELLQQNVVSSQCTLYHDKSADNVISSALNASHWVSYSSLTVGCKWDDQPNLFFTKSKKYQRHSRADVAPGGIDDDNTPIPLWWS